MAEIGDPNDRDDVTFVEVDPGEFSTTSEAKTIRDRVLEVLVWMTGFAPREENPMIEQACQLIDALRSNVRLLGAPPRHLFDSIPLFGYELITRERIRQITQEGWTEAHDDEHTDGSLAIVGAMYAVADIEDVRVTRYSGEHGYASAWPTSWDELWDKRSEHTRLRQLSIAGALIAAEIDRLQRWAMRNEEDERARNVARVAERSNL